MRAGMEISETTFIVRYGNAESSLRTCGRMNLVFALTSRSTVDRAFFLHEIVVLLLRLLQAEPPCPCTTAAVSTVQQTWLQGIFLWKPFQGEVAATLARCDLLLTVAALDSVSPI